MKKQSIIIAVCLLITVSFFSGCEEISNEPKKFSIVSFDIEPSIIYQGEYANLSWNVIGASSVSINNGIGNVTLSGNQIIQPTKTTTYILTIKNETTTKSAAAEITVISSYKDLLLGTWQNQDGSTTMTFDSENTVTITGDGFLGFFSQTGTYTYSITKQKITFSSENIEITLNYNFPQPNQLILSNDQGASITFTKK